jgi:hypothetical protein
MQRCEVITTCRPKQTLKFSLALYANAIPENKNRGEERTEAHLHQNDLCGVRWRRSSACSGCSRCARAVAAAVLKLPTPTRRAVHLHPRGTRVRHAWVAIVTASGRRHRVPSPSRAASHLPCTEPPQALHPAARPASPPCTEPPRPPPAIPASSPRLAAAAALRRAAATSPSRCRCVACAAYACRPAAGARAPRRLPPARVSTSRHPLAARRRHRRRATPRAELSPLGRRRWAVAARPSPLPPRIVVLG